MRHNTHAFSPSDVAASICWWWRFNTAAHSARSDSRLTRASVCTTASSLSPSASRINACASSASPKRSPVSSPARTNNSAFASVEDTWLARWSKNLTKIGSAPRCAHAFSSASSARRLLGSADNCSR
jgi:type II secretory pathway pseudopilin PulG